METSEILNQILNCKGQYISLTTKSNPKPSSTYKTTHLEKITMCKYRAGIEFQNLKSIKDAIEAGERGEIQSLPWGKWKKYPYIIEHNGKEYIRLYPATNSSSGIEIVYKVNGIQVLKEEFNTYLTPSAINKQGEVVECFCVAIENILKIN